MLHLLKQTILSTVWTCSPTVTCTSPFMGYVHVGHRSPITASSWKRIQRFWLRAVNWQERDAFEAEQAAEALSLC